MKNNYLILTTLFVTLFITSCSKNESMDEDIQPIEPVVFESLSASKNILFTNEAVTLNIEGSNFTDVEFVFSDDAMSETKISDNVYEIKSEKALKGDVRVNLKNEEETKTRVVKLEFLTHGVFKSRVVEGIRIDIDTSDRLLEVLGEPDSKAETSSGESVIWTYSSGVAFSETKATKIIRFAFINTSSRIFSTENKEFLYRAYPYLVNEKFDFSNSDRNFMDKVVDELKVPSFERTSSSGISSATNFKRELRAPTETNRGVYEYVYFYNNNPDHSFSVTFFANGIDDYKGENILFCVVN